MNFKDVSTMNEHIGVILVSCSPNLQGTFETNSGGEIIRQTRYADALQSFAAHAADKDKWLYQNTHFCFVRDNRYYSKPKFKTLKIPCANCTHVNRVYGGCISIKAPKLKRKLKLDHVALNRSHMQTVVGLGKRWNRRVKKKSLLDGIEKIGERHRKESKNRRGSVGSLDLEDKLESKAKGSFLNNLLKVKAMSSGVSMRSLAAKAWFNRSNPGSNTGSNPVSRCSSPRIIRPLNSPDSIDSFDSIGPPSTMRTGNDSDTSKASLFNVINIEGSELCHTWAGPQMASPALSPDLKLRRAHTLKERTEKKQVKSKRFSFERLKRTLRRKSSVFNNKPKDQPQIMISPAEDGEAAADCTFSHETPTVKSSNTGRSRMASDGFEEEYLRQAVNDNLGDSDVLISRRTSKEVVTTEVVLAPESDDVLVVARKIISKDKRTELRSSKEELTNVDDLGADLLLVRKKAISKDETTELRSSKEELTDVDDLGADLLLVRKKTISKDETTELRSSKEELTDVDDLAGDVLVVRRKTISKDETTELRSSKEELTDEHDLARDVLVVRKKSSVEVVTDEICLLENRMTSEHCPGMATPEHPEDQACADTTPFFRESPSESSCADTLTFFSESPSESSPVTVIVPDDIEQWHVERIFCSDDNINAVNLKMSPEPKTSSQDSCKFCAHLHELEGMSGDLLTKSTPEYRKTARRRKKGLHCCLLGICAPLFRSFEHEDLPRCTCRIELSEGIKTTWHTCK